MPTSSIPTSEVPTTEVPLTQCKKDFWEELNAERLEPTEIEECSLTKPWLW